MKIGYDIKFCLKGTDTILNFRVLDYSHN
jgi:hypothetical protein